ncbi:MAG: prepilin-type N-terminal cleavage/methylation domain-containing protein [Planctomycetota bacterium]
MQIATPMRHRGRNAFTLIELLVVIAIISLLVGLSFPYIRGMLRTSSEQMAANSVSNAVSAARAFATRYVPFVDPYQGRNAEANGDGYSGAVLIVTPANELRVSENDEAAEETGGRRLELPPVGTTIFNGYKPIQNLDDLLLPRGVAVLGIIRTDEDELQLLPPPFAVSFSRRGDLITQGLDPTDTAEDNLRRFQRADGYVYYDGDGDGFWETTSTREAFAQTDTLEDFRRATAERITFDDFQSRTLLSRPENREPDARGFMEGRRKLPFERLEPVVGIAVFQADRVPPQFVSAAQTDEPGTIATDAGNGLFHPEGAAAIVIDTTEDNNLLAWIASSAGGEVLFFNRRTGAELRR